MSRQYWAVIAVAARTSCPEPGRVSFAAVRTQLCPFDRADHAQHRTPPCCLRIIHSENGILISNTWCLNLHFNIALCWGLMPEFACVLKPQFCSLPLYIFVYTVFYASNHFCICCCGWRTLHSVPCSVHLTVTTCGSCSTVSVQPWWRNKGKIHFCRLCSTTTPPNLSIWVPWERSVEKSHLNWSHKAFWKKDLLLPQPCGKGKGAY